MAISPKSYFGGKKRKPGHHKREHLNYDFYHSSAWTKTRKAYRGGYQERFFSEVKRGSWYGMKLEPKQVTYLLSLDFIPCEICLKLYCAKAYDKVDPGTQLDHIIPLNKENALDSKGFGDPFDFNNLQLLCTTHHSRKSGREK